MALRLVQLGSERPVQADDEGRWVLGRCRELGIASPTVSRRHCSLTPCEGPEAGAVVIASKKRLVLRRGGEGAAVDVVERWGRAKMFVGDTLFLLGDPDDHSSFAHGFTLRAGSREASPKAREGPSPASLLSPKARSPPFGPGSPDSQSVDTSATGEPTSPLAGHPQAKHTGWKWRGAVPRRPEASPFLRRISGLEELQGFLPGKGSSLREEEATVSARGGIFQGCRFVFASSSHTSTLRALARRFGATVDDEVGEATTHVIGALSPTGIAQGGEGPQVSGSAPGVFYVLPAFVSDSIAAGARLQEEKYAAGGDRQPAASAGPLEVHPSMISMASTICSGDDPQESFRWAARGVSEASVPAQDSGIAPSPYANPVNFPGLKSTVPGGEPPFVKRPIEDEGPSGSSPKRARTQVPTEVAFDERKSPFQGHQVPDILKSLGAGRAAWGESGNWVEQWDESSARETVAKLRTHWHRAWTSAEPATSAAAQEASPTPGSGLEEEREDVGLVNRVCGHAACGAQTFCIVEQLEEVKRHYQGRVDQFRIKAVNRGISLIVEAGFALVTPQDVERLHLGEKTAQKVLELLATGRLRRNEEMESSELRRTLSAFEAVWGVGPATAESWYRAGCRSIDDVRRRGDLTETQVVGLKYYEDFQQTIPRDEVEAIAEEVCALAAREIATVAGVEESRVRAEGHARPMGSYLRGKPRTGDIDVLISPPPLDAPPSCGEILERLLHALLEAGIVTQDMHPARSRVDAQGPVTWMGVCISKISGCHRRLDIKVYPRDMLPFAVNYFTGSSNFCRALRYWCNTPTPETTELARAACPNANAFRLSDHGLVPVRREEHTRGPVDDRLIPVGPPVLCACETDIFRAVGLHYVPPTMRVFSRDFS
eukprot:evm.model.scf_1466.5 EVM.evm.TU.scf_1466.5   scf_1466:21114-29538(-)